MPVFVGTSIWYAAADDGDRHNAVARSVLAAHAGELVTSDLVLAELWNLVNARADHHTANRVRATRRPAVGPCDKNAEAGAHLASASDLASVVAEL